MYAPANSLFVIMAAPSSSPTTSMSSMPVPVSPMMDAMWGAAATPITSSTPSYDMVAAPTAFLFPSNNSNMYPMMAQQQQQCASSPMPYFTSAMLSQPHNNEDKMQQPNKNVNVNSTAMMMPALGLGDANNMMMVLPGGNGAVMPMMYPAAMPMMVPTMAAQTFNMMSDANATQQLPSKSQSLRCYYCNEDGHKACHCPKNPSVANMGTGMCCRHNKIRSLTYLTAVGVSAENNNVVYECVSRNPCIERS